MYSSCVGTSYLLAMRPVLVTNAGPVRDLQARAVDMFMRHRLETGYQTVEPGIAAAVAESGRASARDLQRAAARIRGIERYYYNHGDTGENGEHILMGAMILTGADEIREWYEGFDNNMRTIAEIAKQANLTAECTTFLNVFALIVGFQILSQMPVSFLSAGLFISMMFPVFLVGPLAHIRKVTARDKFHNRSFDRMERFLEMHDRGDWMFDSHDYEVRRVVLDSISDRNKRDLLDISAVRLNELPVFSSFGLKLLLKAILWKRSELFAEYTRGCSPAWIGIDRLLRRNDDGEPEMAIFLRAAAGRPRFPMAVTEKAPGLLVPQLQSASTGP